MTFPLPRKIVSIIAFALFPALSFSPLQSMAQSIASKDTIQKYAGRWESKCQDGRAFVVVDLRADGSRVNGTVSIGNMHGDDEGACMLVTAPPTPEHALKISQSVVHSDILSFAAAQSSDGKLLHFEFKETGQNKADLKLLGTPVEQHPWPLERLQRPD